MNDIKKNSKKKYKKIVKQSKFWPIVQLFKDRKGFMNEVSQKSQNKILEKIKPEELYDELINTCLLYTSPSPRDMRRSRMPSSA